MIRQLNWETKGFRQSRKSIFLLGNNFSEKIASTTKPSKYSHLYAKV